MEVVGNTLKFKITSFYRESEPFRSHPHNGIDINYPTGTEVHSVHSGVVERVVNFGNENLGKGVFIKGDNGETSIYGHMNDISIHEGQRVNEGTMIGHSGDTGFSTGPHLHFSEKGSDGQFVDPTHHFEQLTTMSGNSGNFVIDYFKNFKDRGMNQSSWTGNDYNFWSDTVGPFIMNDLKNALIDLFWYIQANIPEIMGSVTLLAAALVMLGIRIPKVTALYGVTAIVAAFWRTIS